MALFEDAYIEDALDIWKKSVSYDFDLYGNLLEQLFYEYHVYSEAQIRAFWDIFELTASSSQMEFYWTQDDDGYHVHLSKKKGSKQAVIAETSELFDGLLHIPDNVMEVISRTYRTLLCCQSIFPQPVGQDLQDWKTKFKEIMEGESDKGVTHQNDKDLIVQTAIYLSKRTGKLTNCLDTICQKLSFCIVKSLLNAEYLILNNYSERLVCDVINNSFNQKRGAGNILPWFSYSFVVHVLRIDEMCLRIGRIIRDTEKSRITIDYHPVEYAKNMFSYYQLVGENDLSKYDTFVDSVIEMTSIDHIFKIDSTTVEKLILLFRVSETVAQSVGLEDYKKTVEMVKAKTAWLITMIFKKADKKSKDYFTTVGNDHGDDLLDQIKTNYTGGSIDDNVFLKARKDCEDKCADENLEKLASYDSRWPHSLSDVEAYDRWTAKVRSTYVGISPVMAELHSIVDEKNLANYGKIINLIEVVEEALRKQEKGCMSSSFYVRTLCVLLEIYDAISSESHTLKTQSDNSADNNEEIKRRVSGLSARLLSDFQLFIKSLGNSYSPSYIPPFVYSFYDLKNAGQSDDNNETGKDKKNQKKRGSVIAFHELEEEVIKKYKKGNLSECFFFASFDATPVFLTYYKEFVEECTMKLHIKILEDSGRVMQFVKDNAEKQERYTDEAMRDMKAENLSTRNHTIQLLGLFAAFIALIASAIGSFKAAENEHEFIIIFFSFTFCVVVFSSLISFMGRRSSITGIKENNDKTKENETWKVALRQWFKTTEHWDWIIPSLFAFILLAVVFVMLAIYGFGDNKDNTTKSEQPVITSKYQAGIDSLNKTTLDSQTVGNKVNATNYDTTDFDSLNNVGLNGRTIHQND